MRILRVFTAALALACAFLLPALAAGGDCKALGRQILEFARAKGISRISVLDFTPKGGAERSEADYIAEEIAARLAGQETPALIERAQLEKILKEARLSSIPGIGADLAGIFSVDAVVTGTVFAAGEKLKIVAKLIEVRSGIVLMAGQAETDRGWPLMYGTDTETKQEISPPPPSDFRDAIKDTTPDCEAGRVKAGLLNSELVEAKARYWAARMKEPGFTLRGLTRNPGTEISDPKTKARFYALLARYYEEDGPKPQEPRTLSALNALMQEETRLYNDCGYR